jgi:aspartate-semialdehyde dehydrogenase
MSRTYTVGIVGATGVVGQRFLEVLDQRNFPVGKLKLFSTARSAGKKMTFRGQEYEVEELGNDSFKGLDLALFSAGTEASRDYCWKAVEAGALVVDNSNAWRMDDRVPLVVPEVNSDALKNHPGLIANPNCSTIQMVVALWPLHQKAHLERLVISTYQSVSGTGIDAINELDAQVKADATGAAPVPPKVYPTTIAFNCLPHIDKFDADGNTLEEMKMVRETRKIFGYPTLPVSATCVRVPVRVSHSESVNAQFRDELTPEMARRILAEAPGVQVVDDPQANRYPLPRDAEGQDDVFVGRIRRDTSHPRGLNLWVVADNVRKGAATNAVQIAERVFGLTR